MKTNKWDDWYNSLPATTKAYLNSQPLWHDKDLYKAFAIGMFLGFIIGLCF